MYFNNPLRRGDVLGLGGLSSGSGVNYGRVSYESLLNGQGTRGGAAYSMACASCASWLPSASTAGWIYDFLQTAGVLPSSRATSCSTALAL